MQVEAVRRFRDLTCGSVREEGEAFEASAERYAEINGKGYGRLVRPVFPDTVAGLKAALDFDGTPYPAKARKAELLEAAKGAGLC